MRKLLLVSTVAVAGLLPFAMAQAGQTQTGVNADKTMTDKANTVRDDATTKAPMTDKSNATTTTDRKYDWDKANSLKITSAEELIGRDVINMRGDEVGEINDIVLSADEAPYAVLEVGGFLGLGEKLVAVPMDQLRIDNDNDDVLLLSQMTEDELKNMPAYEKDDYRPYKVAE
ncbi:MAG: PRC-barrel domain-containing protein [Alphaproteobacteria bacterium]